MAENAPFDPYESIRYIPAQYTYEDSHNSALNLILTLRPEWRDTKDTIEFVRFTDGITNTVRSRLCACEKGGSANSPRVQLLKAINKQPGLSKADIDNEAILLRAYGKDTEVLIDRKSA
jgi:ethanolamine kinase